MADGHSAEISVMLHRFEPALQAFLLRIGQSRQVMSDPRVTAAEAAVGANTICGPVTVEEVGGRAIELLPANATAFERGLAFGMALCLRTEPPRPAARVAVFRSRV